MRFTVPVKFYLEGKGSYNPETGKEEPKVVLVATRRANVTDNSSIRNTETFGNYNVDAKIVRFQREVNLNWSYLLIGSDKTKYVKKHVMRKSKTFSILVGSSE